MIPIIPPPLNGCFSSLFLLNVFCLLWSFPDNHMQKYLLRFMMHFSKRLYIRMRKRRTVTLSRRCVNWKGVWHWVCENTPSHVHSRMLTSITLKFMIAFLSAVCVCAVKILSNLLASGFACHWRSKPTLLKCLSRKAVKCRGGGGVDVHQYSKHFLHLTPEVKMLNTGRLLSGTTQIKCLNAAKAVRGQEPERALLAGIPGRGGVLSPPYRS